MNFQFVDIYFLCRIDELSKLNYAKDVELQSQRAQMEAMQVTFTVYRVSLVVYYLGSAFSSVADRCRSRSEADL